MNRRNDRMLNTIKRSLATVAAASLLAGCSSDAIVAPPKAVDLGSCGNVQVPAGAKLASHVYANGVQTYQWSGTSWAFVSPSAVLFADAAETNTVGIHYAGPTWQGVSGSKVVGTVVQKCTADPNSIPWLLLSAVSSDDPGVFQGATFVQRLNTAGGNAPSTPGSVTGEVTSVPYTAEYVFYRP